MILIAVALVFIALPAGGMVLRTLQNTYGNLYMPTVAFLKQNSGANDIVMGGADLAFGLGFDSNLVADGCFGYYTGKRPKFIVYDSAGETSWQDSKTFSPEFYEYFPRLLNEEYRLAFENAGYKVYERK